MATLTYLGNPAGLSGNILGEILHITPHGLTTPTIDYALSATVGFDETLIGGSDFDIDIVSLGLLITVQSVGA